MKGIKRPFLQKRTDTQPSNKQVDTTSTQQQSQGTITTPESTGAISEVLSENQQNDFFENLNNWPNLKLDQQQSLIRNFELFAESLSTKLNNLINRESFATLKEERNFLTMLESYPTLKWIIDQDFNTNTIYADNTNLKAIADHSLGLVNDKVIDLTIKWNYQDIVDKLTTPDWTNALDNLEQNLTSRYNNQLTEGKKAKFYHNFMSDYLNPLTTLKQQLYPHDTISTQHNISISDLLKQYEQMTSALGVTTNEHWSHNTSINWIISSLEQLYKNRPKAIPLERQAYNTQYDTLMFITANAHHIIDKMKNNDTQTTRRTIGDQQHWTQLKQAYQEYLTWNSAIDDIAKQP